MCKVKRMLPFSLFAFRFLFIHTENIRGKNNGAVIQWTRISDMNTARPK
jgi:hypothetical protein